MHLKVLKILLLMLLLCAIPATAQQKDDAQKQREEHEEKIQEMLTQRIQTFLSQLQADDFQKEIIKQKLHSFYVEQKTIHMNSSLKYFERDEQLLALRNTHFSDIKILISEDTMTQIEVFIKDAGTTLEKEKKKKHRNKNKKDE